MNLRALSPLRLLQSQPGRFGFDAAVRVLLLHQRRRHVWQAMTLRAAGSQAYAPSAVAGVTLTQTPRAPKPVLTVGLPGLVGAGGVLPGLYAAERMAQARDGRLGRVLDWISAPMWAALAQAGIKYRLHRAVETAALEPDIGPAPQTRALLALAGFDGGVGSDDVAACVARALPHLFVQRPRTAAGLAALVGAWLSVPVQVVEFAGGWMPVAADDQSKLPEGHDPGRFCRLGVDACVGARVWDAQSRVVLRVGPLRRAAYDALLPDGERLPGLLALVRAYLGFEVGCLIQPVLAARDIPELRCGDRLRLGYDTWLPRSGTRDRDGDDLRLDAGAPFTPHH